jgi:hypothetical protein
MALPHKGITFRGVHRLLYGLESVFALLKKSESSGQSNVPFKKRKHLIPDQRLVFDKWGRLTEEYMIKPGYRGGAPVILVIGGVIIVLSLVIAGVNHHSKGSVDPVPVHQK